MFKLHHTPEQDQPWHFTVQADNGRVLVTSETYHNKDDAYNGMRSLCAALNGVWLPDEVVET